MNCDIAISRQLAALSPKQRMVLDLVARHHTTKEIARKLHLSPHTVEQRIQSMRTRFGEVPRRELGRLYAELEKAYSGSHSLPSAPHEASSQYGETAIGHLNRSEGALGSVKWTFFAGLFSGMMIGLGIAFTAVVSTYLILTNYPA
jgi:DNA-binding CsgD family transcriptional regulator